MAHAGAGTDPARPPAERHPRRPLRPADPAARRSSAGRRRPRQPALPAAVSRHPAARRSLPARLCGRPRARRRTGAGGCSPIARRRRPASASRSRTGSFSPAACPRCSAICTFAGSPTTSSRCTTAWSPRTNRENPRIVLLTPGPAAEGYFAHAYLARYLGYTLAEGGDLTVRDNRVFLKSVDGLKPVDLILRRVDAEECDPLELRVEFDAGRRRAAAGDARRQCHRRQRARQRPGRKPRRCCRSCRPCAADCSARTCGFRTRSTWWCGDEQVRDYVLDNLDRLAIDSAFKRRSLLSRTTSAVPGASLSSRERLAIIDQIATRGHEYVGQELVSLSTTPAWTADGLQPRPMTLRVFLAATRDDGYAVMPGGLTRVSASRDARADRAAPGRRHQGHLGAVRRAGDQQLHPAPLAAQLRQAEADRQGSAEPRRRQPVLAGPLRRAQRGHHARPAQRRAAADRRREPGRQRRARCSGSCACCSRRASCRRRPAAAARAPAETLEQQLATADVRSGLALRPAGDARAPASDRRAGPGSPVGRCLADAQPLAREGDRPRPPRRSAGASARTGRSAGDAGRRASARSPPSAAWKWRT